MNNPILGPKLQAKFDSVKQLLSRVSVLAELCGDNQAKSTLIERLKTLDAAALFVIVGEVKAGKSSFINALLREDICEVAPDPCTAGIQELVYGNDAQRVTLGDHWERVYLESEVLRSISIVDTPGTNSIIKNHQTITEQYIPQSDLVIFVFPAKNPHTNTAWELLTFIRHEWHRKTVFVLQQSDLASQKELATNIEKVKQYARERNVQNPTVFAVSAKRETDNNTDSGFSEFRDYLQKTTENGDVWQIKMEGAKETIRKIAAQLLAQQTERHAALVTDKAFIETLRAKVASRREKANSLRRLAVDSLCLAYERLADTLKQDFSDGLGVGTILRRSLPFIRDKDIKQWLADLQKGFEDRAKSEIDEEAGRVSKDLCAEIDNLFQSLCQSIESHKSAITSNDLPSTQDRTEILDGLRRNLDDLRISDLVANQSISGSDLGRLALAGGGIAALGAVVALATKLLVVDITGGILAATGVMIVAATLLWKRKAILSEFQQKIEASKGDFRERLNAEIERLFERIFLQLEHRLSEPIKEIDLRIVAVTPHITEAELCKSAAEDIQ
jgi:GTP-binding protein EngB required for normal cell division